MRLLKPNIKKMERRQDLKGLVKAIVHADEGVQREACDALGRIGVPAVESLCALLSQPDRRSLPLVVEALATVGGSRAAEALCDALARGWKEARDGLIRLGAVAVEPLCVLLTDPGHSARAMEILGVIGGARAVEALCEVLERGTGEDQRGAALALGRIGDPQAVDALCAKLHGGHAVAAEAAKALGQIRDARAVDALCGELRSTSEEVRDSCARALGKIADARAVEPLLRFVEENAEWPNAAVEALGDIGDARAVGPLCEVLRTVRRDVGIQVCAREALVAIGAPAVGKLCEALTDEQPEVREAAANALGKIGDPAATHGLRRLLTDPFSDRVRREAAQALARLAAADAHRPGAGELAVPGPKELPTSSRESVGKVNAILEGRLRRHHAIRERYSHLARNAVVAELAGAFAPMHREDEAATSEAVQAAVALGKEAVVPLLMALQANPCARLAQDLGYGSAEGTEDVIRQALIRLVTTDDVPLLLGVHAKAKASGNYAATSIAKAVAADRATTGESAWIMALGVIGE